MVELLRRTAALHGRSLDTEISMILSAHLDLLFGASETRALAKSGVQVERSDAGHCEPLTHTKTGLQMLLEISVDAVR
jgi:plasmid stability protein